MCEFIVFVSICIESNNISGFVHMLENLENTGISSKVLENTEPIFACGFATMFIFVMPLNYC